MQKLKFFLPFFIFVFMGIFMSAQVLDFETSTQHAVFGNELSQNFHEVEIFQIDAAKLNQRVPQTLVSNTLKLNLGQTHQWEFELYPNDMFAENAIIRVFTENGEVSHPVPRNITFKGHVKGNPQKQVRLLIHDDYIYGHVTEGTQRTYISSMKKYVKNAPSDLYVVFDRANRKTEDIEGQCGLDIYPEFDLGGENKDEGTARMLTGLCYDVELGIVSDYSLFTDKGSTIQGALDHTAGVMMDVETDYETADFDDALNFEIVEQIVSICELCDEWTTSTNSSTLLSDFSDWVDDGGFTNSTDMGQFWTNRDFDGTTVGLAYNGSGLLCSNAHHVLQDFTSNDDHLRVLTSHEIGHNLDADHVAGSTYIMSPSVNNTTSWYSTSVTTIDATVDSETPGCIIACASTPCDSVEDVSITSVNSTGFTISWTATTEDEYRLRVRDEEDNSIIYTDDALTSSSSMTINPAGWESCHQYKVLVENKCSGSYSSIVSAVVNDTDQGCADFSVDDAVGWGSHSVSFTDESTGATSWDWDFGDGNTSTSQNPSHTYSSVGVYDVELSINSNAHTMTKSNFVYVLPDESFPYSTSDGGDMSDDDFGTKSATSGATSLFEKGVPSNYFTNSTSCWVTDLDADVTKQENEMALYSPRFDFSNVATATLSFDLGMEIQYCNAPFGVQVQYSTNDGSSWTRLGADTDASWYNRGPSKTCQLATSVFTDEMGWSFTGQSTTYTYDVGSLAGNSSVIFRFVFSLDSGWNGGYARDGAMIDNFSLSGTLPIELVSFDGRRHEDAVQLTWETKTEINNDYFTLERSIDGENFEIIATVKGQGTSYENHFYKYFDRNPVIGVNYYRLTQTDFDGTFEVFDQIVAVNHVSGQKVEVRPNPVKQDYFQLVYNSEQGGNLSVEIFDITGKLLYNEIFRTNKELNYLDIALSGLSDGVYVVKTNQNNYVENLRFVKTN